MKPARNIQQRQAYAEHRVRLAIDRIIFSKTSSERDRATQWARAWTMSAGLSDTQKEKSP